MMPIRPSEEKFHLPDMKRGGLRKDVISKECVECGHKVIWICLGCSQDCMHSMAHIFAPKYDKGRNCWAMVHEVRRSNRRDRLHLSRKREATPSHQKNRQKRRKKRVSVISLDTFSFAANFSECFVVMTKRANFYYYGNSVMIA